MKPDGTEGDCAGRCGRMSRLSAAILRMNGGLDPGIVPREASAGARGFTGARVARTDQGSGSVRPAPGVCHAVNLIHPPERDRACGQPGAPHSWTRSHGRLERLP